ncbi:peptide MFS transporter [Corynebacterium choanae]|uniref:Di-/tripeptide transporter n=1 Tax=Corynebacterium choanae TaxID=1862358 RepID=A0A3G6JBI0_9CORY|nr:oligopeptide:H+ symporter [Corynebacterium choanae]AZA13494.1 Di-/tripeptide transporter [Corynebacterium choanae]
MTRIEQRIEATSQSASGQTPPAFSHTSRAIAGLEMWERFSYYGMQAIVVYYLYWSATEGGLGLDRGAATAWMGAYGALVYVMTIAGGWIADRIAGAETTLLTGASIVMLGHIMLSTASGVHGVAVGLVSIACGSGLLKSCAVTILGRVYAHAPAIRDTAFQYFYLGINIGAFFGPIIVAALHARYGFAAGFGAAAILMAIGLIHYLLIRRRFLTELSPQTQAEITSPLRPIHRRHTYLIILGSALLIALLFWLLNQGILTAGRAATVLLIGSLSAAAIMLATCLHTLDRRDPQRLQVWQFIPVFFASTAFWSVLNQTYGVLAVFSDVRLNRSMFGYEISPSFTQAINPLFILLLTFPMSYLWAHLNREVSSMTKMAVGVMISGLGLLVLAPFAGAGPNEVPFLALVVTVGIITTGELLVGPIGMSTTTALAPSGFGGRFSALYFLTMSAGTATAGVISQYYDPTDSTRELLYFTCCSGIVLAIGTMLLICSRRLTAATS